MRIVCPPIFIRVHLSIVPLGVFLSNDHHHHFAISIWFVCVWVPVWPPDDDCVVVTHGGRLLTGHGQVSIAIHCSHNCLLFLPTFFVLFCPSSSPPCLSFFLSLPQTCANPSKWHWHWHWLAITTQRRSETTCSHLQLSFCVFHSFLPLLLLLLYSFLVTIFSNC